MLVVGNNLASSVVGSNVVLKRLVFAAPPGNRGTTMTAGLSMPPSSAFFASPSLPLQPRDNLTTTAAESRLVPQPLSAPMLSDLFPSNPFNQSHAETEVCSGQIIHQDEPKLEYDMRSCPKDLLPRVYQVFSSSVDQIGDNVTVLTMTYRTENDMQTWNNKIRNERRALAKEFNREARRISAELRSRGYWVDFINPDTGKPVILAEEEGSDALLALVETDEFYTRFGYNLITRSCCRVLSHERWGTHSFVGSLFTNAPSSTLDALLSSSPPLLFFPSPPH